MSARRGDSMVYMRLWRAAAAAVVELAVVERPTADTAALSAAPWIDLRQPPTTSVSQADITRTGAS